MGSSFTEFRGKGFWCRDPLLEVWLRLLSLHIGDDVYKPGWQHDLRDHWLLASAGFFGGCISPRLDQFLTDEHRVSAILQTSERSIQSLRAFGSYVPATFLNALGIADRFGGELPIEWFDLIADRFSALLRGELTTDASTSPVLPQTRKGQTWEEIPQPGSAESSQRTTSSGGCA